ncbi:MAG: hypothetical protein COU32_01080 [Candidatus Magasanikbacteria bacterium CG10_big_fil_rev_8_21_14_0_10_42_10]|uniref:Uncharacterized protein n=1 Tax=Candidatus Magasanikbacteria bacterium CG10_big_fil_rev_8_21_14_0_10_42_10 TaxID=1974649 RepID=A0A2H0TWU4_9BACT|nr:MAG: hypothetical protein COU32_01080 [Candidatus Magasanikbacteria bacterium CG10_big_fil_rev_8_21_14_0_10_42_10]
MGGRLVVDGQPTVVARLRVELSLDEDAFTDVPVDAERDAIGDLVGDPEVDVMPVPQRLVKIDERLEAVAQGQVDGVAEVEDEVRLDRVGRRHVVLPREPREATAQRELRPQPIREDVGEAERDASEQGHAGTVASVTRARNTREPAHLEPEPHEERVRELELGLVDGDDRLNEPLPNDGPVDDLRRRGRDAELERRARARWRARELCLVGAVPDSRPLDLDVRIGGTRRGADELHGVPIGSVEDPGLRCCRLRGGAGDHHCDGRKSRKRVALHSTLLLPPNDGCR